MLLTDYLACSILLPICGSCLKTNVLSEKGGGDYVRAQENERRV